MVAESNLLAASEEGLRFEGKLPLPASPQDVVKGLRHQPKAALNAEKLPLVLKTLWKQESSSRHTQTHHSFVTIQHGRFACFPLFPSSPFFPLNNGLSDESFDNIFEYLLYIRQWARCWGYNSK